MSNFLFFTLGLGTGLGLAAWRRWLLNRQLNRIIAAFPPEITNIALSPQWKLRRGVAWLEALNQRLETEVEQWRYVVESLPWGYLEVDEYNHLMFYNHATQKIFNLERYQAHHASRILLELVRSYELDQLIEATRQTGQPQQESWVFHPSSTNASEIEQQQSICLKGYSLRLPNRSIGVFIEDCQELTLLRESRDRWFSDLAHELRTPLTSIQLVAENLAQRLDGSMQRWATRLIPETKRLINLVQDWLDLTKLETSKVSQRDNVAIVPLVMDVWAVLEPLANRRQIALDCRGSSLIATLGNRAQLFRVLLNLLDNAIQYSPDQAMIRVSVRAQALAGKGLGMVDGVVNYADQAIAPTITPVLDSTIAPVINGVVDGIADRTINRDITDSAINQISPKSNSKITSTVNGTASVTAGVTAGGTADSLSQTAIDGGSDHALGAVNSLENQREGKHEGKSESIDQAVVTAPQTRSTPHPKPDPEPEHPKPVNAPAVTTNSSASLSLGISQTMPQNPQSPQIAQNPQGSQNFVLLDIIDQGYGFAPNDLPHIFERLYRGDQSRARMRSETQIERHTSGSGLGLAIVQKIIQTHQGQITAQNHPVHGGAWIQICLPLLSTPTGLGAP